MSGDFQDWNPAPPDSHNVAPPDIDKKIKREAYSGCLSLLVVVLLIVGAFSFVVWKWVFPWFAR